MGRTADSFILIVGAVAAVSAAGAQAPERSGTALVDALRQGGHVLVMRHASSPRETPDANAARPDNLKRERQLDEAGRAGAQGMGEALRELKIPLGEVLTSPTYRAVETVRMAGLQNWKAQPELGDRGRSMQGVTEVEGMWLRSKASQPPASGNVLLVTHMPNIARAFGAAAAKVADGETLIFRPRAGADPELIGRIPIEDWPRLARASLEE